MATKNILIVGLGNIGNRYLEGILSMKTRLNLHLLEKNKKKTLVLKNYIKNNNFKNKIKVYKKKNEIIGKLFFLAIIATTANKRSIVTKYILNKTKVSNWIIEKPLGQSLNDINFFQKFFFKKNSWVNLPRKTFENYKIIKKILNKEKIRRIEVFGNNWGMCCNGLHFINLFSWLLDEKIKKIDCNDIKKWKRTKRKNFWEAEGKIKLVFSNNSFGILKSSISENKFKSCKVLVTTTNKRILYDETNGKIFLNGKIKLKDKKIPLLSNYVPIFLKKIIKKQKIDLPLVKSSIDEHKIFLKGLITSWNRFNKTKLRYAPIT